jgi:hypothetical protein
LKKERKVDKKRKIGGFTLKKDVGPTNPRPPHMAEDSLGATFPLPYRWSVPGLD